MKEEKAKALSDKWRAEFEKEKVERLKDLKDWHFYKLAVMYEICEWIEQDYEFFEAEALEWLEKYISLNKFFEMYCDRDENMWYDFRDVADDNYRWDKDYGERHE